MQLRPLLVVFALPWAIGPAEIGPRVVDARRAEVARVQHHLDGALALLEARDLTPLTTQQRARRAQLVGALKEYRAAGHFPVNRDVPGQYVPVFVDQVTGIHCAVGHLLALTGETDLVARVVATNNLVRVADLVGDGAFTGWLEENGLTLSEAVRIQPTYGPIFDPGPENDIWAPSKTLSMTMIGLSVGSAVFGLTREPQLGFTTTSALGLGVGILTVGVGLAGLPGGSRASGLEGATPAVAIVAGTAAIMVARRLVIPNTWGPEEGEQGVPRVSLSPILPARGAGPGLVLSIRF